MIIELNCKICNTVIRKQASAIKGENVFCGHSCAAKFNNKDLVRNGNKRLDCIVCGKQVKSSLATYCSHKCNKIKLKEIYLEKWRNGEVTGLRGKEILSEHIRQYIWEKYGNKCANCGWDTPHPVSNKPPLEIEHIDGDFKNNKEENLTLLCPNCHSLTLTYRGRNRGMGRPSRRSNSVG